MKFYVVRGTFLGLILLLGASAGALAEETGQKPDISFDLRSAVRSSFIFEVGSDVDPGSIASFARGAVAQAGGQIRHIYTSDAFHGFNAVLPEPAALKLLEDNPEIVSMSRDGFVSIAVPGNGNNNRGGGSGGGKNGGGSAAQVTPAGVTRVGGPYDCTQQACGTAWIIDTGVDQDNPDLNVDQARSYSCFKPFFRFQGTDTPDDENGHGTHVAGTVAAIDNSIDVVGVAAGAPVVSVRVLDKRGGGTISDVMCGVDYVANNCQGGDVANMSLSGSETETDADLLRTQIEGASTCGDGGRLSFALAAGNSAADANLYVPGDANGSHIYTVSAVDESDVFASFSNYGNPPVDFAAPGVNVVSSKLGGGTDTKSGTSMAAPHVAGIIAAGRTVAGCGTAIGDPDGNPDPIACGGAPVTN